MPYNHFLHNIYIALALINNLDINGGLRLQMGECGFTGRGGSWGVGLRGKNPIGVAWQG